MAHALRNPDPVRPPANGDGRERGTVAVKHDLGDAVGARPGHAVEKFGAALLILAGTTILMAIVTGEALFGAAYTTSQNTISDLGSTWQPGDIVREPSATIFNTAMLVSGAMIVAAAGAYWRAYRSRSVAIALLLLGVGMLGVGSFPGTEIGGHPSTAGLHPPLSMLTFIAGGLCGVLAYRVTTAPFRYVSAMLGLVSLGKPRAVRSALRQRSRCRRRRALGGVSGRVVGRGLRWVSARCGVSGTGPVGETAAVPAKGRTMRVLVAAAGRHGATAEIAETIGGELTKEGMDVDVVDVDDVHGLGDYDAVVLGSAVYMGHWLKSAAAFAASRGAELRARPTWLFSSGPVGDPLRPGESDAVNVKAIVAATGAREHRLFAGKLDKRVLNFRERAVMRAVGGHDGDYRDWDEIRAWAEAIATSLNARRQPRAGAHAPTGTQPIGRQRAPS